MMIVNDTAYDKGKPCVLFNNVFLNGTLTATNGVPENAITDATFEFWNSTGLSYIEVDMGADTEVDCLFIDAHNLFAVSSDVSFEYWNGSAWVVFETITPIDNKAIMFIFKPVTATRFRVGVTDASVGVIMLGMRLVFPNGVDASHTSIAHARSYDVLSGDTISGQFTSSMVTKMGAELSVTFPLLDAEWVDNYMSDFETHYNVGKAFAWASMPSRFPDDMGFCKRPKGAGELRPRYFEGGMYEEFTMSIGVYINE